MKFLNKHGKALKPEGVLKNEKNKKKQDFMRAFRVGVFIFTDADRMRAF